MAMPVASASQALCLPAARRGVDWVIKNLHESGAKGLAGLEAGGESPRTVRIGYGEAVATGRC